MTGHAAEVSRGERFAFGANWVRFLEVLNDERIAQAEQSLRDMLTGERFAGKKLSRYRQWLRLVQLGGTAVGCNGACLRLRSPVGWPVRGYSSGAIPGRPTMTHRGEFVLGRDYLARLGQFDVVYSWGVLHHTGAMWEDLERCLPGGGGGKIVRRDL